MSVATPLLETKLYLPRWRPGLVSRPRLVERLDQGAERALTLLSAPAGFGKTTLLAEWLAVAPPSARPVAWVALDERDNDPTRFWTYVFTALQAAHPRVAEHALALLHAPQPPAIEEVLATLLNELGAHEQGVALVLDDYHLIDARPVHDGMAFLLEYLPPGLRLVIASRADPPLPLSRLRGRGELAELRAADLRFTPAEAATFLNDVMELGLTPDDAAALEARTEGWIAGLQLAALSMQGRADATGFIRGFAGDHRYVVDYLVEEVLLRQPDHIRGFLLQTSILDRLSGPLCDAVTGRGDGKAVLGELERGNLFVVPLDDTRHWYRYHHLFADVLRAHALEEQPERVPALRQRAAAWFEEHGMLAEALEQARAARDHTTVARLLVANVEEFERLGQHASIERWSASLPEEMLRERPRLALIYATGAMRAEPNLQAARRLVAWAEQAIAAIASAGGVDPADDVDGTVIGPAGLDALTGEMLALKLQVSHDLRPDEIAELSSRALELLPPTRHRVRAMVYLINAGVRMDFGDLTTALPTLDRGVEEARHVQDPLLLACVLELRGQVSVGMGRLDDGRRAHEEALDLGLVSVGDSTWEMCNAHSGLAEILLERGDLPGALRQVEQVLGLVSIGQRRSPVLYARMFAARVLQAAGDAGGALDQLEEARAFSKGVRRFRFASVLSAAQLDVYSRMGDLDIAAEIARERGLAPDAEIDYQNEQELTAYARFLIARGEARGAARVLARVLPVVRAGGRVQHEIHALALQAVAHERLGERPLALASLGRATMLGEPGRFTRTFAGEGPVMTELLSALEDVVRRGRGPAEIGSPSYLGYLLREAGGTPASAATQSAAADLVEPLTGREVQILRLIAAGSRNQEIADQLFISQATVKRHIANAYGKLGVSHRTAAIARASELRLL